MGMAPWQLGTFATAPNCAWCLVPLFSILATDPDRHDHRTRDHVIPRARGGRDLQNNVVAACRLCNTLRGDMHAAEFKGLARVHITPYRYDLALLRDHLSDIGFEKWSAVVERVRLRGMANAA